MTDISTKPGSLYKVGGRRYVDSQGVYNLAGAHEVVQQHDGWRVILSGGAVRCALVEDHPELPSQRGALYELSAEGDVSLKAQRAAWLSQGHVQAGGTFETWPGEKPSCCGSSCGCGPCRLKHGHRHDHEETHDPR